MKNKSIKKFGFVTAITLTLLLISVCPIIFASENGKVDEPWYSEDNGVVVGDIFMPSFETSATLKAVAIAEKKGLSSDVYYFVADDGYYNLTQRFALAADYKIGLEDGKARIWSGVRYVMDITTGELTPYDNVGIDVNSTEIQARPAYRDVLDINNDTHTITAPEGADIGFFESALWAADMSNQTYSVADNKLTVTSENGEKTQVYTIEYKQGTGTGEPGAPAVSAVATNSVYDEATYTWFITSDSEDATLTFSDGWEFEEAMGIDPGFVADVTSGSAITVGSSVSEFKVGIKVTKGDAVMYLGVVKDTSLEHLVSVNDIGPLTFGNGTPKTTIEAQLPSSVGIVTNVVGSSYTAEISWDDFDYDPSNIGEQIIGINGRITLPTKVINTGDDSLLYVTISITVEAKTEAKVTSVDITDAEITIEGIGTTETLSVTVEPSTADNKTLNWTSSDETVATVSSDGTVTAIADGTATITATAADGSGASDTCVVTVKSKDLVRATFDDKDEFSLTGGDATLTINEEKFHGVDGRSLQVKVTEKNSWAGLDIVNTSSIEENSYVFIGAWVYQTERETMKLRIGNNAGANFGDSNVSSGKWTYISGIFKNTFTSATNVGIRLNNDGDWAVNETFYVDDVVAIELGKGINDFKLTNLVLEGGAEIVAHYNGTDMNGITAATSVTDLEAVIGGSAAYKHNSTAQYAEMKAKINTSNGKLYNVGLFANISVEGNIDIAGTWGSSGNLAAGVWTPRYGLFEGDGTEKDIVIRHNVAGGAQLYVDEIFVVESSLDEQVTDTFNVTYNFTNIEKDGLPTKVVSGGALEVKFIPEDQYELPATIEVTMGGSLLSVGVDYTYGSSTGDFEINKVTGDVEITVTAKSVVTEPEKSNDTSLTSKDTAVVVVSGTSITVKLTSGTSITVTELLDKLQGNKVVHSIEVYKEAACNNKADNDENILQGYVVKVVAENGTNSQVYNITVIEIEDTEEVVTVTFTSPQAIQITSTGSIQVVTGSAVTSEGAINVTTGTAIVVELTEDIDITTGGAVTVTLEGNEQVEFIVVRGDATTGNDTDNKFTIIIRTDYKAEKKFKITFNVDSKGFKDSEGNNIKNYEFPKS